MKFTMYNWLYLDSYIEVTFSHKKRESLLLNILDSKKYLLIDSSYEIINRICKNDYSIKLSTIEELEKYKDIINLFERNFLGGIIYSEKKPFILYPKIKLESDLKKFTKLSYRDEGSNILDYFFELSIYFGGNSEIPVKKIINLINQAKFSSLSKINIIIDNFHFYKNSIKELLDFLIENGSNLAINIQINIDDYYDGRSYLEKLKQFSNFFIYIKIVNIDFDLKVLAEENVNYIFKIYNYASFLASFRKIDKKKISYCFELDFDKADNDFVKEFAFLKKGEIFDCEITKLNFDANKVLNKNLFGKLFIKNNKIFNSQVKAKLIGKLDEHIDLKEIIFRALIDSDRWFYTRNKVTPCKSCVYRYICPPISEFEIYSNYFNICYEV